MITGLLSDGATRTTNEDVKTVFGTFLIVPHGQRVISFLNYTLPTSMLQHHADEWVYHLVWQKQSGAWPVTMMVP